MTVKGAALVLIVAACAAACSSGTPAEQRNARARAATGDIVVGAAWPWKIRENLLYAQGLEMALDEINAAGGVRGRRIRIVKEDDHESVDEGRAVAQKLAADPDVVTVIGHLQSFVTVPAAAIYDASGVLLIAPTSTDPALTEQGYRMVFRTTFTDGEVGSHMATVATARAYRRMAIYYMRDRYGRSLANAFEETFTAGGGVVVDRQSYDPSEGANPRQLDQLIEDWRGRDLNSVFIAGEAAQAALLISTARKKGLRVPFLGGDALGTPELFTSGDAVVEGVTIASPFHADDSRPEVRTFDAAFQKRFGRRPDTAAALAYEALQVVAEAMKKAPSTAPADVAAALRSIADWRGTTGGFSFSGTGDRVHHPLVTVVARKGQFAFLSNGEDARASVVIRTASAAR